MELIEAERMARTLMTEHGVGSLAFAFDNAKRRLGCMHWVRIGGVCVPQKITLSRHYAVLLPEHEVRDTILHEIAHALTPGHHHNAVFMNACRKVGATPRRCAAPSDSPAGRVTAECPDCLLPLAEQHRLPQRIYVCRVHRKRALRWMRDGVEVPMEDMPNNYRLRYSHAVMRGIITA